MKTEPKHTPGPWNVNFKKFSEVRTENGAVVAECKKLTGLVNLQANARLIAAAPELLLLLQDALADYAEYAEGGEADEWVKASRAAVAKALGAG